MADPHHAARSGMYPPWSFPAPVGSWSISAASLMGLCWPLGFAPFHLTPLPMLLLAALFALVSRQSARAAFWHAYLFALAGFVAGLYWISHTLHDYGSMGWPLAIGLMLLLAALLAFLPALGVGLSRRFVRHRDPAFLLAMPAAWILMEWLRATLFTGFPWLSLGYSQTLSPLGGLAPWLGVFGVGLAAVALSGLLAWSWAKETRRALWLIGAPAVMAVVFAAQGLGEVNFTHPAGPPLKLRLLQGNIPQAVKWTSAAVGPTLQAYTNLLLQSPPGTNLVVMPESAIPLFRDEAQPLLKSMAAWSKQHRTKIILGIDERVAGPHGVKFYNSALVIQGELPMRSYRKRHLVPFGEYLPLRPVLGAIANQLVPGQGDFSAGHRDGFMDLKGEAPGLSICYEAAFGNAIRNDVRAGAQFLLNISNDDWFGHTIAPHQHLQMAEMRARENQRDLARATNTGITVFIGPDGRPRERLPQFVRGALDGEIQPRLGLTPYARWGDTPVLALVAIMLLGAGVWEARLRRAARRAVPALS